MDTEKPNPNLPYPEPPPPYSTIPPGINPSYASPPNNPNYGGVPQFQAGYGAPQTQTVVMGPPPAGQMAGTVTVVNVAQWGPYPVQIACPHCGAQVLTQTNTSPGLLTWLLSGALLFFGCWLGCCLIPCCIPECQDVEHRCPNCKHHLGSFRRL